MGVSVTFFFAFSGSSLGLDPRGLAVLATEPTSCVVRGWYGSVGQSPGVLYLVRGRRGQGGKKPWVSVQQWGSEPPSV